MSDGERRYVDPVAGRGAYEASAAERPSVFLVSVDQLTPDAYGRGRYAEHLRTPNLDSLFADGLWFENAFCNSPLCGPSRAAYLTGRYPYLTVNEERAHDGFATALRPGDIIFPEYLRAVGYRTRHVGKCHVGAHKFADAFGQNDRAWDRWAPPVFDDDEYREYCRELGVEGPQFREQVGGLMPDRETPGNRFGGWVEQPDGSDFPIEATYPWFLARKAADLLPRLLGGESGRPIYLQLDFFAPHQPFFIPAGMEERAEALAGVVEPPDSYRRLVERGYMPQPGQPQVYATYQRNWGLYRPETRRRYVLANLLQIEVLDRALGAFLDVLRERGLYEPSMVVFLGDHGEMNGEKGLIDKGVFAHPKVARVPLVIKLPDGRHAGERVGEAAALLDLAPTVLGRAGVRPEDRLDGLDLLRLVEGPAAGRPEPFLFEAGWHVTANPAVALIDSVRGGGLYLYAFNLTSAHDELYRVDGLDFTNLASDETHREVRRRMARRLAGVLRSDPRWRCYWHAFRVARWEWLEEPGGDAQMFAPD